MQIFLGPGGTRVTRAADKTPAPAWSCDVSPGVMAFLPAVIVPPFEPRSRAFLSVFWRHGLQPCGDRVNRRLTVRVDDSPTW
ncbi:MAG: hypothetical protein ACYDEP_06365 [Acidimicrobiales bacterium]